MIRIQLDDRPVREALARLQREATDLSQSMREIGELLVARTKERFAAGRAPDGSPWPPNTPATIEAYLRRRFGGRIPRKRGAMTRRASTTAAGKQPLIGESRRLSSEIAYRATPSAVEIGSSLVYAATQQFGARRGAFGATSRGASIPWGDIPARPFLGLSEADRRDVVAIVLDGLRRAAG